MIAACLFVLCGCHNPTGGREVQPCGGYTCWQNCWSTSQFGGLTLRRDDIASCYIQWQDCACSMVLSDAIITLSAHVHWLQTSCCRYGAATGTAKQQGNILQLPGILASTAAATAATGCLVCVLWKKVVFPASSSVECRHQQQPVHLLGLFGILLLQKLEAL